MKKVFFLMILGTFLFFNVQGQNFLKVDKSNSGKTVLISQDQVLEINLQRKSSTGYIWCEQTTSTGKAVQQSIAKIGDDSFIHDDNTGLANGKQSLGQSGTQVIRYVGSSLGETVLKFELKRPWEKNGQIMDEYTITVVSSGKYTGTYTPPVKVLPKHETLTPKSVPSSWDWRTQCTPIANQQYCGDCWAFASVGTLECNILIKDGVTRDISEKFVTDCYTANNCSGCSGGTCAHQAWLSSYTAANPLGGGAVYEAEDPWTTSEGNGTTGTCNSSGYAPHETIDSYADVSGQTSSNNYIPPDANMKTAIYNFGPIFIAVDASSTAWNNYSGGIFTEVSPAGVTDHAVILVGWVDSAAVSGGGYWILRNSWGSSWGINGYMYISFGSDLVGQAADYIIYKGGITHAVVPVSNFAASSTSSCKGTITFTDLSSNSPTSWLWNFGDGTTSTSQNPTHAYSSSGTYTVSLKATNAYGNNTFTKTSYITISLPTAPTTTGASTATGGSVTLHASGSGTLKWYDAITAGNLVNIGISYTISNLTANKTFYVESDVTSSQPTTVAIGMSANTPNGGAYTSTARQGEVFNALVPITIKSVTVYASTTASRTIFLLNSAGTELDSLVTTIASGTQTVTLNFNVPVGTGYILGCSSNNSLWRETSGGVYPYTISNVVSITGNTAGTTATAYYYYFYNWQVEYSTTATCISARVPVTASVTTGINENTEPKFEVYPNPNDGEFTISIDNISFDTYKMTIVNYLGQDVFTESINNSTYKKTFNFKNLSKGIYFIKLQGKDNILYNKMIKY